jgi:hypothetical protein
MYKTIKLTQPTVALDPQTARASERHVIAPSKARRILRGGSPRRVRVSHPPVSSLGPVAECKGANKAG